MDLDELKAKLENKSGVVYPTGDYDKRERMAEPTDENSGLNIPRVINLKIMEYRIVMHDLDDDLQQSITSMSKRGWEMFKAYEPDVYKDSPEDSYIRIIWQREAKPE